MRRKVARRIPGFYLICDRIESHATPCETPPLIGVLLCGSMTAQHGQYINDSKNPAIGNPQAIAAGASSSPRHAQDATVPTARAVADRTWSAARSGCGKRRVLLPHHPRRRARHRHASEQILRRRNVEPGGIRQVDDRPREREQRARQSRSRRADLPRREGRLLDVPRDSRRRRPHGSGPDRYRRLASPRRCFASRLWNRPKAFTWRARRRSRSSWKNGKEVQGIARNRNNYSLQVIDRAGNLHLLSMLDVEQLTVSTRSPMPGDFATRLNPQELQDLIAFLARQTVRPSGASK